MRNLFFIGLALLQTAVVSAQTTRQIEVKVIDEHRQPLAGADVIVQKTAPPASPGELFDREQAISYELLGKTDAMGLATVRLNVPAGEDVDEPLQIYAWKEGYSIRSASVMKKAELQCLPLMKRTFQIVDFEEKPLKGLRVEHRPFSRDLRLCPDEVAHTNEFGLVTVSGPARSGIGLVIHEPGGLIHHARVVDVVRSNGQQTDPRDVAIVRLSRFGKIEGKMAAEFSEGFGVRYMPDYANSSMRIPENWTTAQDYTSAKMNSVDRDGRFSVDAVPEGNGWIIVYRREPMTPESGEQAKSEPIAIHPVEVKAGEITTIEVKSQPTAKVSGRIVSSDGTNDWSDARVSINRTFTDADRRITHQQQVARATVAADGSFVCFLSVGTYTLSPVFKNQPGWKIDGVTSIEVGAGAATVATKDITVTPLKKASVVWKQKPPSTVTNFNSRITFYSKVQPDKLLGECQLTEDGYGKVYLPSNAPSLNIFSGSIYRDPAIAPAFVDNDPTDNFDLELIRTARGKSTNVAIRGRVVDANGTGLAKVPVNISLSALASTANGSRGLPTSLPIRIGSNLLDTVVTDSDGRYEVPPRQIFAQTVLSGNASAAEHRFKFTVAAPTNPNPVEVTKEVVVSPEKWNETDVELPDLVLTTPVGGNRLVGKVLKEDGQPSAGELLRLIDKGRMIRVFSDSDGQFSIDDIAGSTWLLREKDWTIRAVNDSSQPLVCELGSQGVTSSERVVKKLPDQEARRKLAKELLQAIPTPANFAVIRGLRVQLTVTDDFYLAPEKTFNELLLINRPDGDSLRSQYANFWTNISDEQLQKLAEAMTSTVYRVQTLRMIAERSPSVKAYESVINAIEFPESANGQSAEAVLLLDHLAAVGVKLHLYGMLEPHRDKIRQFVEQYAAAAQQPQLPPQRQPPGAQQRQPQLPQRAPAPNMQPPAASRLPFQRDQTSLKICRALLNPDEFAAAVLENMNLASTEPAAEDRMAQMDDANILLQLFPLNYSKISPGRMMLSLPAVSNWGETSPLEAFEAFKRGTLPTNLMRVAITSAMASRHPDAEEAFWKSIRQGTREESALARAQTMSLSLATATSSNARPLDQTWYATARRLSPEMGRAAAWQLAADYLNGRYDEGGGASILPVRERQYAQMLGVAYCTTTDHPEIAQQIVDRALPALLSSTEQEFGNSFSGITDISCAAWFDPQATVDLLLKLKKKVDEEQKNRPGNPAQVQILLSSRGQSQLLSLRQSCLRGLLLEEF